MNNFASVVELTSQLCRWLYGRLTTGEPWAWRPVSLWDARVNRRRCRRSRFTPTPRQGRSPGKRDEYFTTFNFLRHAPPRIRHTNGRAGFWDGGGGVLDMINRRREKQRKGGKQQLPLSADMTLLWFTTSRQADWQERGREKGRAGNVRDRDGMACLSRLRLFSPATASSLLSYVSSSLVDYLITHSAVRRLVVHSWCGNVAVSRIRLTASYRREQ